MFLLTSGPLAKSHAGLFDSRCKKLELPRTNGDTRTVDVLHSLRIMFRALFLLG
jgi:hypothetical protein